MDHYDKLKSSLPEKNRLWTIVFDEESYGNMNADQWRLDIE